jgi:hypothetical protein
MRTHEPLASSDHGSEEMEDRLEQIRPLEQEMALAIRKFDRARAD